MPDSIFLSQWQNIVILSLLLICSACSPGESAPSSSEDPITGEVVATSSENPLLGAWAMQTVNWITPDTTYTIEETQPGMLLYSEGHYSLIWTPTQEPRQAFENLSSPTDEETIAAFQSIIFNAGSYELSDTSLITTSYIARVPGFEGGNQIFKYSIDGDRLELRMYDETYPDGNKPDWLGRLETEFILQRMD